MDKNNFGLWYKDILGASQPFKDIFNINKAQKAFGLDNMADQFGSLAAQSGIDAARQRLELTLPHNQFSSAIDIMQLSASWHKDNLADIRKMIVADSIQNAVSRLEIAKPDLALSMKEIFTSKSDILAAQIAISESIGKDYFSANHLAMPSWLKENHFKKHKFNEDQVSFADILSANTLTRITENFITENEDENGINESLQKITDLLNENSTLKTEIQNLYFSFGKHIASKLNKRKKLKEEDLKEPTKMLTSFIHKNLLKENFLRPQTIYTIICIIEYVFSLIIIGIILEAKGGSIYNSVMGEDEKIQQVQPAHSNNTHKITDNYQNILSDFVIKDASIYIRNSIKARCFGKIKCNTSVLILTQKPKWCLVEALVTIYNKKTKTTLEVVKRGWVMKKNLDYFQ